MSSVVKLSQNSELLVKTYESKLYGEDTINSDVKSTEAVISTLKVVHNKNTTYIKTSTSWDLFLKKKSVYCNSNGEQRSMRNRRCSMIWRMLCRGLDLSASACLRCTTSVTSTWTGTRKKLTSWTNDGRTFTLRLTTGVICFFTEILQIFISPGG